MKNKTFLIVGLGLIGGSYARGLKKHGLHVTAIDKNAETIDYAIVHEIIDSGASINEKSLIAAADIIISGLYPAEMISWIAENQQYFKTGALITDVSGVKQGIVDAVQSIIREDAEFIGCHPMAGKEASGVQNSDEKIFEKANFIITPTGKNTAKAIRFAEELAKLLNFRHIAQLSPEEHDRMIGFVSQLTHVIAVTLMNMSDNTHLAEYTGDSFRDLTRIARINDRLWSELFMLNKNSLLEEIDKFVAELANFREKLASGDTEAMRALFMQSTARRILFDRAE